MTTDQLVHLALGVVLLLCVTYAVLRLGSVRLGRAPLVAVGRGAIQLAVIGVALRGC